MYTIERAPITGAVLPIMKQTPIKNLCAEMIKAEIIPGVQTIGYQNGVSGFIYNSEIAEIHKNNQWSIDYLIGEYADSLGEHPYTVIANCAGELGFDSLDLLDVLKTIIAVEYLATLVSDHCVVRTNLTDSQGYEMELRPIEFDVWANMRANEDYELLSTMLTREKGGDFELTVDNENQLSVVSLDENENGEITRETYTVDFYVESADYTIVVL
jgi:hypothetical protein